MKYFIPLIIVVLFFSLLNCSDGVEYTEMDTTSEAIAPPSSQTLAEKEDVTSSDEQQHLERKLIKNGSIEFETFDIQSTREIIFSSVKKNNSYISSDEAFNSPGFHRNTIVIRVPSQNFDKLVDDTTKGVEIFDTKSISVKDVTEEFLDIQARLKTKKELENRFLDLLQQANSVTDILEIEKEISSLRSDIESIEGRLKFLQNQVSYSTLTLSFYQEIPSELENKNQFIDGFKNGWDNLILFFIVLINAWPFILISILIVYLVIWLKRKRKKK